MRKVDDGEKKIMLFILATNVIASRPPERRPTGTPHTRAKIASLIETHQWTQECNSSLSRIIAQNLSILMRGYFQVHFEINFHEVHLEMPDEVHVDEVQFKCK